MPTKVTSALVARLTIWRTDDCSKKRSRSRLVEAMTGSGIG